MQYRFKFSIIVDAQGEDEAAEKVEQEIEKLIEEQGVNAILNYGEIYLEV